ncbi:hypothetical protein PENTCL1PPCAC_14694 [Pristionchus entomophagus]|uniref:G protein-coupled receptor n=1 Tax=Pristionchus entomophagus TaxID=358040 RepID=A0AAV5TEM5_9BILA|nr:hypothetical protein PENTCL1PPCAC_14694 [Pristionchus entomophagus]
MTEYHGYTMDFSWDREYFMPFIESYCLCFGWVQIGLAFILLYLLFNHSSMYSKEFRNAIAAFHIITILYDFHHSYLFIPYPLFPMPIFVCHGFLCRWGAPTRLLMTFNGLTGCGAAVAISVVVFMRLRNLLPFESRFRLSMRLSIVFMTVIGVLFMSNVVGFALYFGDDPRKTDIINRSEFVWLREQPDSLVWGDIFDTPAFDIGSFKSMPITEKIVFNCIHELLLQKYT